MQIKRSTLIKLYLLVFSLFLYTSIRSALYILLPVFSILYIILFREKIQNQAVLLLLSLIALSTVIGSLYLQEFFPANTILSVYVILSIIIFYFTYNAGKIANGYYFHYFIRISTCILLANNLVAFVQLLIFNSPLEDDAFVGFYGSDGLGVHSLAIINFLLCAYYFLKFQQRKKPPHIALGIFFLASALLSFYGLGLIVFISAVIVYNLSLKTMIKSAIVSLLLAFLLALSLYYIKPKTFAYNYNNVKLAVSYLKGDIPESEVTTIPRKLIVYKNYYELYVKEPVLFIFGSGPGTFNSRASFLLNGDYSSNKLLRRLGNNEPKNAKSGAYPLWNSKITSAERHTDGTRNQPFSSVVALLAEYGFLFTSVLTALVLVRYKRFKRKSRTLLRQDLPDQFHWLHLSKFFQFSFIFLFLLLLTDNYLEYPEIVLLFLLHYKLIELTLNHAINESGTE